MAGTMAEEEEGRKGASSAIPPWKPWQGMLMPWGNAWWFLLGMPDL